MTSTEQRRIIRRHYGLNRPVTEEERIAEIQNLERKRDNGQLCDRALSLAASLRVI